VTACGDWTPVEIGDVFIIAGVSANVFNWEVRLPRWVILLFLSA